MYLQKVVNKNYFVGILNVTDEKSRIPTLKSVVQIPGSVPKCHETTTLIQTLVLTLESA
jgi:hypothetical protein